jgi:hypothetical protein
VEVELAKLREDRVPFFQRRWVMAGAMAALALAIVPKIIRSRREDQPTASSDDIAVAVAAPEMLENADILSNLDLLEDFDVLMSWDGKEV